METGPTLTAISATSTSTAKHVAVIFQFHILATESDLTMDLQFLRE
jgi:hypothetical protein